MSFDKPTLCLDFDGVIHGYQSGWQEADFIPDPPVPGALSFLHDAIDKFEVVIFSSRSHQPNGVRTMQLWLKYHASKYYRPDLEKANKIINHFCMNEKAWPKEKPAAFLTIDDRALTFTGAWPDLDELKKFKPWNKK